MTTAKIKSGSGFNERGGVVFTIGPGVFDQGVMSTAINRTALPEDQMRYGITEYADISAGATTQSLRAAIPGRQIEVLSYVFVVDAASSVTFNPIQPLFLGLWPVQQMGEHQLMAKVTD